MRLFHFSDEPDIKVFAARPVRIPVERPAGKDWLNGPLVWAIDDAHQPLYLFPRECPRILVWPTLKTNEMDRAQWFGDGPARMIAFIEAAWLERFAAAKIYRYVMPAASFEEVGDVGMWVSQDAVTPLGQDALTDLRAELESRGVDLCIRDSLLPLKVLWRTSLHASGIRLRNIPGWGNPGWPHSAGQGK